MKVAVVAPSPVPFRLGGAERLWEGLHTALTAAGHDVEVIKLPVREYRLDDLVESYAQFLELDLSHFDAVISGKYPAWAVDHPNHVVWMLHPLRGLYDTFPRSRFPQRRRAVTPKLDRLLADPEPGGHDEQVDSVIGRARDALAPLQRDHPAFDIPGEVARAIVHRLDRACLSTRRIRRHVAISRTVATRPGYFPDDAVVSVAWPPTSLVAAPAGPYGNDFLSVGRLEVPKRVDLVIEAFLALNRDSQAARLTIVGEGSDRSRLEGLADGHPDIEFAGRLDDAQLVAAYARARAVVFAPRDEDFGYVSLEAMAHARPVITTTDAGGPAEVITPGHTGMVVAPKAEELSAAMAQLLANDELTRRLGAEGRRVAGGVSWATVVDRLLAPSSDRSRRTAHPRTGDRGRRIVALSTYPVWRRNGGGPVRAWHLLNGLARRGWAVEVVSITPDRVPVTRHLIADHPEAPGSTVPGPGGVVETVVPLSPRHLDAEARLRLVTGPMAITDIAAGLMWRATPTLEREARNALAASDAVVLVQPYFADLAGLGDGHPVVLDAHNHETSMKAELLPANPGGHWLSDRVAELECRALHEAAVVTATTAEDLERLDSQAQGLHVPTGVIPNGADVGNIEFVTGPARRQCRRALLAQLGPGRSLERVAVFVGSGHGPNIEAGRRLVRMAAQLPDVLFVLAGRHSELLGLRHIPDNVRLEGVVDEQTLKRLMEGADVALNPMAHGGGSNIKLVEYFAAGVPVVSTPLGTRGLVGAEQLAVVSDLDGFGDAIAGLLSDPQHCDALAEAARAHAAAHLDWTVLADRFAALVTTTLR